MTTDTQTRIGRSAILAWTKRNTLPASSTIVALFLLGSTNVTKISWNLTWNPGCYALVISAPTFKLKWETGRYYNDFLRGESKENERKLSNHVLPRIHPTEKTEKKTYYLNSLLHIECWNKQTSFLFATKNNYFSIYDFHATHIDFLYSLHSQWDRSF